MGRIELENGGLREATSATDAASVERFDDVDMESLIRRQSGAEQSGECAICLANITQDEDTIVLPCAAAHVFHAECCRSWLSRNVTCPLCRVDVRHLVRLTASPSPATTEILTSPRAFGYTRDGGVISRYEPHPPPEVPRPHYIPPELHSAAEIVEIDYPDRGTARVWRVPRQA